MKIDLLQFTDIATFCHKMAALKDLQKVEYAGGQYRLEAPSHSPLKVPINSDGDMFFLGKPRYQFNFNYPFSASNLCVFPNASLIGNYVLLTHDNQVLTDSFSNAQILQGTGHFLQQTLKLQLNRQATPIPFVLFQKQTQNIRKIDTPTIVIPTYWHFNYHHWVIDLLPRLQAALELPELADCKIILPAKVTAFQQQSIDLLSIPKERLLYFDGGHWQCRRLYYPNLGQFRKSELTWLKNRFYQALNIENPNPEKRLYITRRDATTRRVVNETEVINLLKKYGFEVLNLSELDWATQVRRFSEAKIVVGPHGAGLTNLIFSAENATLIELMPGDAPNQCFWLTASVVGQSYAYLVGQRVNAERDFQVKIETLKSLIEQVIC